MTRKDLEVAVVGANTVVQQSRDRLEHVLAAHNLTGATAQALWSIDPAEAPPTMKTMAARLFCNAPNLTFVVTQLVDKGLVERTADPSDRRMRVVILTDVGREVRQAVIDAALTTSPLARLDSGELRQLTRLFRKALATDTRSTGC